MQVFQDQHECSPQTGGLFSPASLLGIFCVVCLSAGASLVGAHWADPRTASASLCPSDPVRLPRGRTPPSPTPPRQVQTPPRVQAVAVAWLHVGAMAFRRPCSGGTTQAFSPRARVLSSKGALDPGTPGDSPPAPTFLGRCRACSC